MKPDARPAFEGRTDPAAPTQSHIWPMVRSHPKRRDYKTLVCTLQQTERIMELSDEERGDPKSRAMLTRIFDEYLYVPENEYVHQWEVGDLVIWGQPRRPARARRMSSVRRRTKFQARRGLRCRKCNRRHGCISRTHSRVRRVLLAVKGRYERGARQPRTC